MIGKGLGQLLVEKKCHLSRSMSLVLIVQVSHVVLYGLCQEECQNE